MRILNNHIFFYTNWLSNFHKCRIEDPVTGLRFLTSEQAYMWFKARFFEDEWSMSLLTGLHLPPREAKQIGRQVVNFDDVAWGTVKYGYMVYSNYLKYSQNADIKEKLLATENKILAEASPTDLIWGIGFAENAEENQLLGEWPGRNLLGKALMEVREMLKIKNINANATTT